MDPSPPQTSQPCHRNFAERRRIYFSRNGGAGEPSATHAVSNWLTLPPSKNAAMTDGMQPRWPMTCCWAGITRMRLLGSWTGTLTRFAGGSCGSPSPTNHSTGVSVRTAAASSAGTTP